MGTHTILFPDDSAATYSPLDGDLVSAKNRIADKALCPLAPPFGVKMKAKYLH